MNIALNCLYLLYGWSCCRPLISRAPNCRERTSAAPSWWEPAGAKWSSEMNSWQKSDQFRLLNHSCSSKDMEVILQPHSKLPFNLDINVKFSSVLFLLLLLSSSSSLDSSSIFPAPILQLLFFSSSSLAPFLPLLQCSHPAALPSSS